MKKIRKIFNIKKKKDKRQEKSVFNAWEVVVIALSVAIFSGTVVGITMYRFNGAFHATKEINDILDTYKKIEDEYYEDVNLGELADAAVAGMLNYLDEKYSQYLDADSTTSLQDRLSGKYQGIGIGIMRKDDVIEITNVYDDTPASQAGIQVGDVILKVNDYEVTLNTPVSDLSEMIKNMESEVILTLKRGDETLTKTIAIDTLEVPLDYEIYTENDKKIGYISIETFSDTAASQVEKIINKFDEQGIAGLILDVRFNTGGYLNAARDIASLFLKKGKIIYSLESKNSKTIVKDKTNMEKSYPIAVLVNQGTASASEVLAAALKESYGATLIGEPTYGKGKVQQTSTLSDDTMIKYTTAKWFTPSGDSVDGVGIAPGIYVELSEEYYKNPVEKNDNQLTYAREFLAK